MPQQSGNSIINSNFLVDNITYPIDNSAIGIHHFYGKIEDQAGNQSDCVDLDLEYYLEKTGLAYLPKIALVGNNSPLISFHLKIIMK